MPAYVDLHSHWVPGVDDGARSVEEGLELLAALAHAGFHKVVATPHMRPGVFDNRREDLLRAFQAVQPHVQAQGLVEVGLGCEHFLDDIVFCRIMDGEGLPYPGDRAVLIEFPGDHLPTCVTDRLFDIRRKGLRPVLAHPERYAPAWKSLAAMEDLVDRGVVLLLDVGALAGKYGRAPRKTAEKLLERGLYYAACSDAHRASDVPAVVEGIRRMRQQIGEVEADYLLTEGPRDVLEGRVDL